MAMALSPLLSITDDSIHKVSEWSGLSETLQSEHQLLRQTVK